MFGKLFGSLAHDVGIDLGTRNTLVYVKGKGIVINEPSVVAINKKTKQLLAIGTEAWKMVGKTPANIVAIRPLVDGVVSDFEVTEQMLRYFIDKVHRRNFAFLPRPRVVVGIPYGVTEVEKRAVEEAATNAGARQVFLIEEPMAAAIGARLPVQEAVGNMIIDIGGGTTEVAMISLGGIVASRSLRIAGDEMNDAIVEYARDRFNLLLGDRTAENIKIHIGSAFLLPEKLHTKMKGRDLVTGLPKEITVNDEQIRESLAKPVTQIVDAVKVTLEETPPELLADVMEKGIVMAGGGALLKGLDVLISNVTETKVFVADDPITCVARGTGIILEDIDALKEILLPSQYEKLSS